MDQRQHHVRTLDDVKRRVSDYYRETTALREVTEYLRERHLEGWLFGGAIRDLMTGRGGQIRDLDIVVIGSEAAYDTAILTAPWETKSGTGEDKTVEGKSGHSHTTVAEVSGMQVDLWHISKQRGIKGEVSLWRPDLVPATTFSTIESVVALAADTPEGTAVHDQGFLDVLNSGVMRCRMEVEDNIDRPKHALKALVLSERLGLELAPDYRAFCADVIKDMSISQIVAILENRYGYVPPIGDLVQLVAAGKPKPKVLDALEL